MTAALVAGSELLAAGAPSRQEDEETGAEPMGAAYLFGLKGGRSSQRSFIDAPGGDVRFFGLTVAIDDKTSRLPAQAVAKDAFTTPASAILSRSSPTWPPRRSPVHSSSPTDSGKRRLCFLWRPAPLIRGRKAVGPGRRQRHVHGTCVQPPHQEFDDWATAKIRGPLFCVY